MLQSNLDYAGFYYKIFLVIHVFFKMIGYKIHLQIYPYTGLKHRHIYGFTQLFILTFFLTLRKVGPTSIYLRIPRQFFFPSFMVVTQFLHFLHTDFSFTWCLIIVI